VHDCHARNNEDQKLKQISGCLVLFVLIDGQEQDRSDKADGQRIDESRVHSRAPHLCGVVSARRFRGCALDDADKILRALEHADAARSALGIRTRPQNQQATLKSAIEPISSHRPRRLTGRNLVPQNWDRSSSHSLFSPSQRLRQDY